MPEQIHQTHRMYNTALTGYDTAIEALPVKSTTSGEGGAIMRPCTGVGTGNVFLQLGKISLASVLSI